jgi:hypothetical protein
MTPATLEHAIFQHLTRYGEHPNKLVLGPADATELARELQLSGLEAWTGASVESLGGLEIMGLRLEIQAELEGFKLFN